VPRFLLLAATVVLIAAGVVGLLTRADSLPADVPVVPTPPGEAGEDAEPLPDPYAWAPERADEFVRRATAGNSHLLYALSPGGAAASAERTAQWRPLVERAAGLAGVDADTLEALVFLESAGRPDARAPGGGEAAAGLTQILAETGSNLLGMRVDATAGERYTKRLERAERRGLQRRAEALRRARARVDERFDPERALAGTARYLTIAAEHFDRQDLRFVSYHMGIGNLEDVVRAYGSEDAPPYVQLYFDSTPRRNARAYRSLAALGDDSSNYWWKLLAAREIMRLWREDRPQLDRLAALHTAKASAEEVLHPPDETETYSGAEDLQRAWDEGVIVPFPQDEAVTGLRRDRRMGELARRIDQPAERYQGLRRSALAMALYIGAQVRDLSGGQAPLTVTSTVRDGTYQRALADRNREATRNYSLHTTGWAFDVLRDYRSRRQALAFQFVLDRLRSLNAIAWVREPRAIHITAGPDAEVLLPLLERVNIGP
jgi:hypothetical protein